jgi:hypothetical protein
MSRLIPILVLFLLLLTRLAAAQSPDTFYSLPVPLRGTVEDSVARAATIIEALGGHLQAAKGQRFMMSEWPDGRRCTIIPSVQGTPSTIMLNLQCVSIKGGAEALCREIAQRYTRAK